MSPLLLVNFGGPRNLQEIEEFLIELLTDRDVVRTKLPCLLSRLLFTKIAKKRAKKIAHDYEKIGGKSPIFEDTEKLARLLSKRINIPILTFHRYLPATHATSLQALESCNAPLIRIFPLFPQFSYATTGSIARFLANNLSPKTVAKLRWIPSFADHPLFIHAWICHIQTFLDEQKLLNPFLLFSAHGVPRSFIETGDPYESECVRSYAQIQKGFSSCPTLLSYQSKFGRGEWLRPYTDEICKEYPFKKTQPIVIIPLTFTSDHIETLFEIEEQYVGALRDRGFDVRRCPALNFNPDWIDAVCSIIQENILCSTNMLIDKRR